MVYEYINNAMAYKYTAKYHLQFDFLSLLFFVDLQICSLVTRFMYGTFDTAYNVSGRFSESLYCASV